MTPAIPATDRYQTALHGMLVMFALALFTGVAGLLLLPSAWDPVFASVAGLSGIGLSVAGYAIQNQ